MLSHITQAHKGLHSVQAPAQIRQHLQATPPAPMLVPRDSTLELHILEFAVATLYTDNCGRFPIQAQSGNQYIRVEYHNKANVILINGFHTRHDRHHIPAYNDIMQRLKDRGIAVTNQVLDNEASEEEQYCW